MQLIDYRGFTVEVGYSDYPLNPREYQENMGTMVCLHKRHRVGDDHNYTANDFTCWEDMEHYLNEDAVVMRPLYLLDHSTLSMSHNGFGDFHSGLDSGRVGVHYIKREKAKDSFGTNRFTEKMIEDMGKILDEEIKEYNAYLSGMVYTCRIQPMSDPVPLSFNWYDYDAMVETAKAEIDSLIRYELNKHIKVLKAQIINKAPLSKRKVFNYK